MLSLYIQTSYDDKYHFMIIPHHHHQQGEGLVPEISHDEPAVVPEHCLSLSAPGRRAADKRTDAGFVPSHKPRASHRDLVNELNWRKET